MVHLGKVNAYEDYRSTRSAEVVQSKRKVVPRVAISSDGHPLKPLIHTEGKRGADARLEDEIKGLDNKLFHKISALAKRDMYIGSGHGRPSVPSPSNRGGYGSPRSHYEGKQRSTALGFGSSVPSKDRLYKDKAQKRAHELGRQQSNAEKGRRDHIANVMDKRHTQARAVALKGFTKSPKIHQASPRQNIAYHTAVSPSKRHFVMVPYDEFTEFEKHQKMMINKGRR